MTCLLCKGEMQPGTTIHTVQMKKARGFVHTKTLLAAPMVVPRRTACECKAHHAYDLR